MAAGPPQGRPDGRPEREPNRTRNRIIYGTLAFLVVTAVVAFGLGQLLDLSFGASVGWAVLVMLGLVVLVAVLAT